MLCIALSSYSLSPWQAGTQTARLGPEWEGSLPRARDIGVANSWRRAWENRRCWSLSTKHTAGKIQEISSALTGTKALLVLSTFSQAKSLLSLLLPHALADFRNLTRVSDNVIFNLLQAGLGSHMSNSKGGPQLIRTPAPWPMNGGLVLHSPTRHPKQGAGISLAWHCILKDVSGKISSWLWQALPLLW